MEQDVYEGVCRILERQLSEPGCVYNCTITYTPFPLSEVALLLPITPTTDPCRNTRNPANQIAAHRSARTNRTPAC